MSDFNESVREFLAQKRIAVAGVSRNGRDAGNMIYRKLRKAGYTVFAINPNATTVEHDPCFPDLSATPEKPDAVMVATRPDTAMDVLRQCAALDIRHVWLHQAMRILGTSVSNEAAQFCEEHGITLIPGGCPMMFCEPVDFAHKCMRWLSRSTGNLPAGL